MKQTSYSIISKGEYDNGKSAPRVYPKQYVILKNANREKFLSLRFFNGLKASVTRVEFILYQMDSAGNVIRKHRVSEEISSTRVNSTFALASGIKLCDKCTDFKIRMIEARCGRYVYSLKHKNASAVYLLDNKWKYDPDNQGYASGSVARSKMKNSFALVRLLAAMFIIACALVSAFPILKYLFELLR